MKDRVHERQSLTFSEFAERYLSEEAEAKLKPGTITNYRIAIRKHAVPDLGRIKLNKISNADLARLHTKIGKTSTVNANRTLECISSIFRYAVTCNIVPLGHNPTKGIRAFRENRRERFLNSEELARLGSAIREAETVGIPYEIDETKPTNTHRNPKIGEPRSTRIQQRRYAC
jgi:site-specific recombinase XerD